MLADVDLSVYVGSRFFSTETRRRFDRAAGQPKRATKMVMTPDTVRVDNSKRGDCRHRSLATHRNASNGPRISLPLVAGSRSRLDQMDAEPRHRSRRQGLTRDQ